MSDKTPKQSRWFVNQTVVVATFLGSNTTPTATCNTIVVGITEKGRVRVGNRLFDADGVHKTLGSAYWSKLYTRDEWRERQTSKVKK